MFIRVIEKRTDSIDWEIFARRLDFGFFHQVVVMMFDEPARPRTSDLATVYLFSSGPVNR